MSNNNFGMRIKQLREHFNMTQTQFAQRLGLSRNTVVNWESGKSIPDIETAGLMVNEFKVNIYWLIMGVGKIFENKVNKNDITEEQALKVLFDEIDEVVLYLVKSIKDPLKKSIMFSKAVEFEDKHDYFYDKIKNNEVKYGNDNSISNSKS